ncbi:hypothetical protein [Methylocystis parvus]|uniref:hypothetical protein n=1 Tax=Methylocystis parvus TaxID=134 RepID=UPI003C77A719
MKTLLLFPLLRLLAFTLILSSALAVEEATSPALDETAQAATCFGLDCASDAG